MNTVKKHFVNFILLFSSLTTIVAQTTTKAESSDPKAKVILDKLKKQYESYQSLDATFSLTIESSGSKISEKNTGKISQQGDKYRLETDRELIICDGKTVWLYLKDKNQVQISDADPKDKNAIISPKQIMKMYDNKDFIYSLAGEGTEATKTCSFIEFKPVKKNSDYTKLRMAVDKSSQVVSIKAFSRDASRYTMQINSLKPNPPRYATNYFGFDKNDHKGVKIEDLRID